MFLVGAREKIGGLFLPLFSLSVIARSSKVASTSLHLSSSKFDHLRRLEDSRSLAPTDFNMSLTETAIPAPLSEVCTLMFGGKPCLCSRVNVRAGEWAAEEKSSLADSPKS